MHLFHSFKLWPQGDSLVINSKIQAVWLIKRYFNSWIGTQPRAEHRQMDWQGCWVLGSVEHQVLPNSTFHALTSKPSRLLSNLEGLIILTLFTSQLGPLSYQTHVELNQCSYQMPSVFFYKLQVSTLSLHFLVVGVTVIYSSWYREPWVCQKSLKEWTFIKHSWEIRETICLGNYHFTEME